MDQLKNLKEFLPHSTIEKNGKYYLSSKDFNPVDIEDAEYYGTFLGEDKEGKFIPSFAFLEMIQDRLSRIYIKEKAAYLFTCGRDIFLDSVVEKKIVVHRLSNLFLVFNVEKDLLGIARLETNAFKNVFDIGYYLRRDMTKTKPTRGFT